MRWNRLGASRRRRRGGPIGLAAAAHLVARGLPAVLYEAGPDVASHVLDWGHVRLFTPWRFCVDPIAAVLLDRFGWSKPAPDVCPTGAEFVGDYLRPLSAVPELRSVVRTGARVTAITRQGLDKTVSRGREDRPSRCRCRPRRGPGSTSRER